MAALHTARISHDASAWYALLSPAIRAAMTLDAFKADLGLVGARPIQPAHEVRVTLERFCQCQEMAEPPHSLRCVTVLQLAAGPPPGRAERWIETWDRAKQDWYWVYREPQAGNPRSKPPRCPGEPGAFG